MSLVIALGAMPATAKEVPDAGALISLRMDSTVGVLLDDIPAGPYRDAAARYALDQHNDWWEARARSQARLASYRLVFRGAYYEDGLRGPLPLPPQSVWKIALHGRPHRQKIQGHDVVVFDYALTTYIVTGSDQPAAVEPALTNEGGTWNEPLLFPVDPELLLQRTGYACMDEEEFPPHSVFEENTYYFFDQTCDVETPDTAVCHITEFPTESCADALANHVGAIAASMRFRREKYYPLLAARYRAGDLHNPNGADLSVVQQDIAEEHRIFYRFIDHSGCEIAEGAVGGTGWRRLLSFSASVSNDGSAAIHMGDVTDPNNPFRVHHDYEFSACHAHFHFSHYGTFDYNGSPGLKRAFCLEETNRFHNDEATPLVAPHQSCEFQGIERGWGDEYQFGLLGQWVDITDVDASEPHDLTFHSNADQFLCEGQTLDADNRPVDPYDLDHLAFDPSPFTDPDGTVQDRIRCRFPSGWDANNTGRVSLASPAGSYVTEACRRGQIGPLRDAGFHAQAPALVACAPGETVNLSCHAVAGAPQVLRLCERSERLGTGVACAEREAVANAVIDRRSNAVSFTCPKVRDAAAPTTGGYSAYSAPLLSWLRPTDVVCSGW